MPPAATIYVVDDDASFLAAIGRLLRAGGFTFQTFGSAAEFLARSQPDQPGCLIADLHMPGFDGLELQDALVKADHPMPIVFLTGQGDIPASVRAIKQGAEDFLTKPVKKEILFAAIERALAKDSSERATRTLRNQLRARLDSLTPREREVLEHVMRGQLNKQIAADLNTSERTIKAHRANIMAKLQVRSVAELVHLVHQARR